MPTDIDLSRHGAHAAGMAGRRRLRRGFSLAEMMLVIVVTSVAGALALPSLSTQVRRAREPAEVEAVHAFLSESRNLARRLNRCVVVTIAGRDLSRALYPTLTGCVETDFCTCRTAALASAELPTKRLSAVVTSTAMTSGITVPTALTPVQGAAASAHTRLIFLADGSTPYGSNVEVGVNFDSGRSSGIVVMAGSGIARKVLTRTTTLGAAVKSDVQTAKTTAATAAPAVTTSAPFTPSSRRPDRRPHRRRRRRARRARGFSLLEVLMASILFLTSLAGLLSGMQTLLNIEEHQRRLTLGSRIGQAEMERALLLAPCVTPSAGTTDTCLETKAKFYSKDGSLLTAAASDGFRVDRSVANPGTAGVPDGLRRIDIVVGWSETAGRRDVGFSTYRP